MGLDENVSKMDVDRRRQRRPVCGRHRPVEKLSLVDVDQLRPVEKRQDGRRRPVEKFSYLLLGGRSKGRTLQLQLTLKLSIKGKKRKDSCFLRFYISFNTEIFLEKTKYLNI